MSQFTKASGQKDDPSPLPSDPYSPAELGLTRAAYKVNDLLELLPFGRTRLYEAMNSGELKYRQDGKSRVILAPDVAEFLNRLSLPASESKSEDVRQRVRSATKNGDSGAEAQAETPPNKPSDSPAR